MRERIGAVGGSVTSGPQLGGGFVVSGFVPYSTVSTQSEDAAPASESPNAASSAAVSSGAAIMPMAAPTTGTVSMATDTGNAGVVSNVANAPQSAVASQVGVVQPAGVTTPAGAKMPRPVSQMSSVPTQAPPAPITIRLRTILSALRSKPIQQASATGEQRLNWIERMSQWTERHYLLTDLLLTILVAWMLLSINPSVIYAEGLQLDNRFDRALTIIILIPLIFRRRFPESSALAVAILAALQLLFFEPVSLADILASLVALYSAVLYGRDKAWRWTGIAAISDSVLFGCKIFAAQTGYRSIFSMLTHSRPAYSLAATPAAFASAIMFMVISLALCISATAMARWDRSSGSNALVLQAREEALRAEQAKQRILAANMERDRISESIQSEVTMTLTSVIDQAVAGLRILDDCERHGEQPSSGAISEAFAAIGSQGRAALAHMRKLLGVLRETGFSDEAHRQEQPGMQLRPAASLDKQLHDSQLHGIAS
ncbi:two component system histidine kinase [Bifidobacterium bifidum]|nr:two component system histidine kinase [Bifidobacterium bifidum]